MGDVYKFVTREEVVNAIKIKNLAYLIRVIEPLLDERDAYREVAIDYACLDENGVRKSHDDVRAPQVDSEAARLMEGKK